MGSLLHSALCVLFIIHTINCLPPRRKFEYKLSFKGPHLVQRDGSIPFWEHGGHAIASDESIRITPSLRSKKGHVWSKEKNTNPNWEVIVTFRVSGRGRIGADGLGIWYTEKSSLEGGNVFGSTDKWNGLAVFFDSFDNDGQHNNPYIMGMVNDGTLSYNHQTDGSNQQLGGCLRDVRNKPFPAKIKIEYYQKTLTVAVHTGMTEDPQYELCLRAENVDLPAAGHFGVSAATGGLADDHDVQSFITHSLVPQDDAPVTGDQVPEEERKRFEQEFDDYWKKLQSAKEEFQRQHPDMKPEDFDDPKWYESQDIRELKQIFEGQNAIHGTIREMQRKLDEIVGRQERTLSQLGLLGSQIQPQGHQGQPTHQGQPSIAQMPINRVEVDTILNQQRELVQASRDLRTVLNDVSSRANAIQAQMGPAGTGYDNSAQFSDLKNHMNNIQNDVKMLVNKPVANNACPPPPVVSCVSTFYFLMFGAFQVAIIIGYTMYRSSREASAKKFY